MNIQGKMVLVTGASSGMGAAISMSLAEAGATVLLLARNAENLETDRRRPNQRRGPEGTCLPGRCG